MVGESQCVGVAEGVIVGELVGVCGGVATLQDNARKNRSRFMSAVCQLMKPDASFTPTMLPPVEDGQPAKLLYLTRVGAPLTLWTTIQYSSPRSS